MQKKILMNKITLKTEFFCLMSVITLLGPSNQKTDR